MLSRRHFLGAVGAGVAGTTLAAREPKRAARKKMAIVTTEWRYRSHAWHMAERFLVGYPDKAAMAPAAARRGLGLRRSDSRERSEPEARRGVRLPDLSDDRRGAALRRRQAGRRCRADHRRARRLPEQRVRPEEVSALRVLQAGDRRLSRRTAARCRSSTTSTCRGSGSGPRRWSDISRELEFPVPGRLVAAGDVADAVDRHAVRGRGRGGAVRGDRRRRQLRLPRPGSRSSAWPSGARGGETGVAAVQALRGDAVWKAMDGRLVAGGRLGPATVRGVPVPQPDAGPAADVQPSLSDAASRCASGSRTRSPTASSTPTA